MRLNDFFGGGFGTGPAGFGNSAFGQRKKILGGGAYQGPLDTGSGYGMGDIKTHMPTAMPPAPAPIASTGGLEPIPTSAWSPRAPMMGGASNNSYQTGGPVGTPGGPVGTGGMDPIAGGGDGGGGMAGGMGQQIPWQSRLPGGANESLGPTPAYTNMAGNNATMGAPYYDFVTGTMKRRPVGGAWM